MSALKQKNKQLLERLESLNDNDFQTSLYETGIDASGLNIPEEEKDYYLIAKQKS